MSQRRFSKISYLFFVLAVILLLIFFNFLGWLNFSKNIIYGASLPLMNLFQSVDRQVAGVFNFLIELKGLNQENKNLKDENKKLFFESTNLKEVLKENELLRQRLTIASAEKAQLILAKIVGYLPQVGQYFLVDKGNKQGVVEGLVAVTADNFFVGRAVQVGDSWAKILLALDSDSLVNVLTQDTRVRGIVRGDHGLGLVMEMIPIDSSLTPGETVLTSGVNDQIPGGLIVGQISSVEKKESDIFQRAILRPAVDFHQLEQVFIIKPGN